MIAALIGIVLLSGCHGAIKFAAYYEDHMVLQRGPQQAVVWGHATKIGDTVKVQLSGKAAVTATVTKDTAGDGVWKVKLPAVTDKGPFSVTATSSEGTVTIKDVLFGDVWLCSGQSNMVFTFTKLLNHTAEMATALKHQDIRYMRVGTTQAKNEHTDLTGPRDIATKWSAPAAGTLNSFSAVCWLFGEYLQKDRNYPIGLVDAAWGGTRVEVWSSHDALADCPNKAKRVPTGDSVLWNSMIHPLLNMTIYGSIWYQGENNAAHADHYSCQFPAMINDWRQKFHDGSMGETSANFPFGFVQLAPFRHTTAVNTFPALRYAQTADHGIVPNKDMQKVFMAVAADLPDFHSPYGSIHPRFKQDVAQRLVMGARNVAYNEKNVKFQGPFPSKVTMDNTAHTVTIDYNYGPITVQNNNGFDVCCSALTKCGAHDKWLAAPIKSHDSSSVVLDTSACAKLKAVDVRYIWRESPCDMKQCAIYGADTSLPAPPYFYNAGKTAGGQIVGK